jgi:hypothetical protein
MSVTFWRFAAVHRAAAISALRPQMARKRASFQFRDVARPPEDQPWRWHTIEMMESDAWRESQC